MAGRTQAALYEEINLDLSWSEAELPQAARTKHVHSLHPYLGKFVPQLVEFFLHRCFQPGDCIYDPFDLANMEQAAEEFRPRISRLAEFTVETLTREPRGCVGAAARLAR